MFLWYNYVPDYIFGRDYLEFKIPNLAVQEVHFAMKQFDSKIIVSWSTASVMNGREHSTLKLDEPVKKHHSP